MNLNIPVTPTTDTPPDAVRLALLKRDEACRQAMAEAKAARLAGNAPAKKAKRRRNRAIKGGQMNPSVYLSAFEVTE
jgi:hypothetical protein